MVRTMCARVLKLGALLRARMPTRRPNMGGKSVLMRQAALTVIMAQVRVRAVCCGLGWLRLQCAAGSMRDAHTNSAPLHGPFAFLRLGPLCRQPAAR
jgi:hypothetical protein